MAVGNSLDKDRGQAGFGVIEIVIVVGVAAVVMTMALVFFGRAKARYEINQKAQNIVWHIERARSIAIKYNQTLTLGFASRDKSLGFTCNDCTAAKSELPPLLLPSAVTLSSYPTLTLRGNGTIDSTSRSITLTGSEGRQVTITINTSGRVTTSDVSEEE